MLKDYAAIREYSHIGSHWGTVATRINSAGLDQGKPESSTAQSKSAEDPRRRDAN